ncbi:MAG: hypothetical protein ACLQA5_09670 [Solirubrobacteraceae bacterium]
MSRSTTVVDESVDHSLLSEGGGSVPPTLLPPKRAEAKRAGQEACA